MKPGSKSQVLKRFKDHRGVRRVIQAVESRVDDSLQIISRTPRKRKFKSEETRRAAEEGLKRGQAKKGEIRNPYGRPKGQSISEALREIGRYECSTPGFVKRFGKGYTFHQAIAMQAQFHASEHNDRYAREFVAERTEGRVPQTILTDPPPKSPLTDAEKALILDLLERATIPAEQPVEKQAEGGADANT